MGETVVDMSNNAYVTLATNDTYALGAMVLGSSLEATGTLAKRVVLVTNEVTDSMRQALNHVFHTVKEVDALNFTDEDNLRLLNRPELSITFTKVHCWQLLEFKKCVFLDADTLVLTNVDELFEREEFSAAPDVGWPDFFNSGVFVFTPSEETYQKLYNFALEKGSFDGGDQGLLNQYFSDWAHKDISKHLPFIYNMCSTACYSYLPAYKYAGSNAKIVHFIGSTKPWIQNFNEEIGQVQPLDEFKYLEPYLQKWWEIFRQNVRPHLTDNMNLPRSSENIDSYEYLRGFSLNHPQCTNIVMPQENSDRRDPWEEFDNKYHGVYNEVIYDLNESPSIKMSTNITFRRDLTFNPNPIQVETYQPQSQIFPDQVETSKPESQIFPDQLETSKPQFQIFPDQVETSKSQYQIYPDQLQTSKPQFQIFPDQGETSKPQSQIFPDQVETSNQFNILLHISDETPQSTINNSDVNAYQNLNNPADFVNADLNTDSEARNNLIALNSSDNTADITDITNNELLAHYYATTSSMDLLRRQNWETGNMDYTGADSYNSVWGKISQTVEDKANIPVEVKTATQQQQQPPIQPVEAKTVTENVTPVASSPQPKVEGAPIDVSCPKQSHEPIDLQPIEITPEVLKLIEELKKLDNVTVIDPKPIEVVEQIVDSKLIEPPKVVKETLKDIKASADVKSVEEIKQIQPIAITPEDQKIIEELEILGTMIPITEIPLPIQEIKPVVDSKPIEKPKVVEEIMKQKTSVDAEPKPVQEVKPAVEVAAEATEEIKIVADVKVEQPKPAEEFKIIDDVKIEQPKLADQQTLVEQPKPVEEPKTLEPAKKPEDVPKPVEELKHIIAPLELGKVSALAEIPKPAESKVSDVEKPVELEPKKVEEPVAVPQLDSKSCPIAVATEVCKKCPEPCLTCPAKEEPKPAEVPKPTSPIAEPQQTKIEECKVDVKPGSIVLPEPVTKSKPSEVPPASAPAPEAVCIAVETKPSEVAAAAMISTPQVCPIESKPSEVSVEAEKCEKVCKKEAKQGQTKDKPTESKDSCAKKDNGQKDCSKKACSKESKDCQKKACGKQDRVKKCGPKEPAKDKEEPKAASKTPEVVEAASPVPSTPQVAPGAAPAVAVTPGTTVEALLVTPLEAPAPAAKPDEPIAAPAVSAPQPSEQPAPTPPPRKTVPSKKSKSKK